ncbi:hypothetical protein RUM43_009398 [Polyplax serrata]|uniref:Uncharacterized protein n=1 Tax=Polyplax serrata TaxID=468196 RepID=A0AAN8NQE5_POLSC
MLLTCATLADDLIEWKHVMQHACFLMSDIFKWPRGYQTKREGDSLKETTRCTRFYHYLPYREAYGRVPICLSGQAPSDLSD